MPVDGHLNKTVTALAGEFLVAAKLCLKGYVASLTLKNYAESDIFVYDPESKRNAAVQVKTIKGGWGYFLPEHVAPAGPAFVFVRIDGDEMEFYVVPPDDVERVSTCERDEYLAAHPRAKPDQPRMISIKGIAAYRDAWENITFS